jgi:hypothetical protein
VNNFGYKRSVDPNINGAIFRMSIEGDVRDVGCLDWMLAYRHDTSATYDSAGLRDYSLLRLDAYPRSGLSIPSPASKT